MNNVNRKWLNKVTGFVRAVVIQHGVLRVLRVSVIHLFVTSEVGLSVSTPA